MAESSGLGGHVAKRLPRPERREQILRAAARAFAGEGFAATSLDDVAQEAGVTRAILYRHFESKTDLYRAVLERAQDRLADATGAPRFGGRSVDGLLAAAADDPDGFRLLFQHAVREPEFRAQVEELRSAAIGVAFDQLSGHVPDPAWTRWAAHMAAFAAIEGAIAWLEAGQPDRDRAARAIQSVIAAIVQAASR